MMRSKGYLGVPLATILATSLLILLAMPPADAALPGMNGRIAFQSNRTSGPGVNNPTADFEIFTMNPDGTGLTQITDNTFDDTDPAFSPDGEELAFASRRSGNFDIYIMGLCWGACGGPERLTHAAASDVYPTWSPDGKKIAFASRRDNNWEIYATASDTATSSPEINLSRDGGAEDENPAWSPDGQKMAFSRLFTPFPPRFNQPRANIFTMRATDGADQINLTNTEHVLDTYPAWSPDGSTIAFSRAPTPDRGNFSQILKVQDGFVSPLFATTDLVGRPTYAPDGQQVAYCVERLDVEIYTRSLSGPTTGGNRTNSSARDCAPDWQRPVNPRLEFEATGMGLFEGIDYGQSSTLSGRLTAGGQPVGNEAVTLEQRPFSAPLPLSSGWTAILGGTVSTSADGTFRFSGFRPERSVYLRARFAGDASLNLGPAKGPTRALPVHAVVTLDPIKVNPVAGRPFTYQGSIVPTNPGRDMTLIIRRRGDTAPFRERSVLVAAGRYGASFTLPGGLYSIEARFPGSGDYVGDSDTRAFRVAG